MATTEKNANSFDMTSLTAVNSGYSLMLINNSTNEGQLIRMTDLANMIINEDQIPDDITDRIDSLENRISGITGGVPTVVSSTSEMTDTDKIYILSTDGMWYYHNGSAWVAGGEYGGVADGSVTTDKLANKAVTTAKLDDGSVTRQKLASGSVHTGELADGAVTSAKLGDVSVTNAKIANGAITANKFASGVIDDTLSQKGAAADSGKVGEEIGVLSDALNTASKTPVFNRTVEGTQRAVIKGLDIPAGKYYLKCDNVSTSGTDADTSLIAFYDSDGKNILSLLVNRDVPINEPVVLTKDVKQILFCAETSNNNSVGDTFKYENVVIAEPAVDDTLTKSGVPADAKVVGDVVESMSDRMDTALSGNVDFSEYDGYYGQNGDIWRTSETQKEKYTNKINVEAHHNIWFTLTYPEEKSAWAAYCTFDADGNFISRNVFMPAKPASSVSCKPEITSDTKFVAFTYRSYGVATVVITADYNFVKLIDDVVNANVSKIRLNHKLPTRACYDHLFVSNEGTRITIPHESLYHVRASRLFGFNCIEANVHATSDGVFIVNHLVNNKFDRFFVHADGVTDISGIDVSTVTWDWIVENVRYKTSIPQYRTRPCRLEEFLGECRQQEIIPFITSSDAAAVALANQYMGKGNFIAYNGDRDKCPTEVIYRWMSEPTKEDILAKCELYGKPFIYGMGNVKKFSDSELEDIVKAVHEAGYWIGVSYVDENWHKYTNLGFDVNGAQARINRIDNGNICNLDSLFNFDDFVYTNATEANGTLVFSSDGTIAPKIGNDAFSMCAFDVEISFVGTITIPAIGEGRGAHTYSSDGSYPFFVAIPVINGSPKVTIAVNNGTIISDIKYKASKF